MSTIIADLSNGLESKKVAVVLDFTFDYIMGMEVAPELKRMLTAAAAENATPQDLPEILECANFDFQVFNAGSRKGWGLRAGQKIGQSNLPLFEYAGVLKMANNYQGEEDEYFFGFEYNGHHFLVDANKKGNLARFCNHSCEPNCYTQLVVTNEGMPHLFVRTKRQIEKDEELTLDYGEEWWTVKFTLNCACGSEICKYNGKEDEDVRLNDDEDEEDEDEDEEEDDEEEEDEEEKDDNENAVGPQKVLATKCVSRIKYASKSIYGNGDVPTHLRKKTAAKAVSGPVPKQIRQMASKAVSGPRMRSMASKAVNGPIPKHMQKRNMARKWIG